MKKRETEFKFRLPGRPAGLNKGVSIKQLYLDISSRQSQQMLVRYFKNDNLKWPQIREARLRIVDDSQCFLTLKSSGAVSRDEFETEISKEAAEELQNKVGIIGSVHKKRFRLPLESGGLELEIDVYSGNLAGLVIAELEFDPVKYPSREDIISLVKSKLGPCITDVTKDPRYKNRQLATVERIPDLQ